jgi:hypothetical protein
MKLSTLSILLGLGFGLPQVYGLVNPKGLAGIARGLPRATIPGTMMMILATVWFLYNVNQEAAEDFVKIRNMLLFGFGAVGLLSCVFVQDFLGARGVAVLMLLLARTMVDAARWEDTGWRLVISSWAYVLVLAGMWFTISPWRLRDWINWNTASDKHTRIGCGLRLAFCALVLVLGLTVFPAAELRMLQ